jgi:hypothetical protein
VPRLWLLSITGPSKNALYVLRLKMAKNFQPIENCGFRRPLNFFNLDQSGKIREATFAAQRDLEIFWTSKSLTANTPSDYESIRIQIRPLEILLVNSRPT